VSDHTRKKERKYRAGRRGKRQEQARHWELSRGQRKDRKYPKRKRRNKGKSCTGLDVLNTSTRAQIHAVRDERERKRERGRERERERERERGRDLLIVSYRYILLVRGSRKE
jgi:hypothetical protein